MKQAPKQLATPMSEVPARAWTRALQVAFGAVNREERRAILRKAGKLCRKTEA